MKSILHDNSRPFHILQFTDLHLRDIDTDAITFQLMEDLIQQEKPHLVICTGDHTMSSSSPSLYAKLSNFLNRQEVPWTLVFGNHDTDYGVDYQTLMHQIQRGPYCLFDHETDSSLGYGNHVIQVVNPHQEGFALIFCLDTHVDHFYQINGQRTWGYSTIHPEQIEWVTSILRSTPQDSNVASLYFFHIPILEFTLIEGKHFIDGAMLESISAAPVSYGFFDMLVKESSSKGCFVGHDHYNDFSFEHQGILLAFGRVSGQYDYRNIPMKRGARLITLENNQMHSKLVDWNPIIWE